MESYDAAKLASVESITDYWVDLGHAVQWLNSIQSRFMEKNDLDEIERCLLLGLVAKMVRDNMYLTDIAELRERGG